MLMGHREDNISMRAHTVHFLRQASVLIMPQFRDLSADEAQPCGYCLVMCSSSPTHGPKAALLMCRNLFPDTISSVNRLSGVLRESSPF